MGKTTAQKYSLTQLAIETGFSRNKIAKLIRDKNVPSVGVGHRDSPQYYMKDIIKALMGDELTLSEAQARLATLRAEEQAMKNEKLKGMLFPRDVLEEALNTIVSQIVSKLDALPIRMKTTAPELSNAALDAVRTETALLRDDIAEIRIE